MKSCSYPSKVLPLCLVPAQESYERGTVYHVASLWHRNSIGIDDQRQKLGSQISLKCRNNIW